METIPALNFDAIGVEILVAGDAPDIGGDAEFLVENFLGAENFVENGAAAEELRAELGFALACGAEFVHAPEDAIFRAGGHGGMA